MDEHQHNPRVTAAKAFIESLDQLQTILASESPKADTQLDPENAPYSPSQTNPEILEEAAADLDAFFGEDDLSEVEDLNPEI
jgi:hypothetical protein